MYSAAQAGLALACRGVEGRRQVVRLLWEHDIRRFPAAQGRARQVAHPVSQPGKRPPFPASVDSRPGEHGHPPVPDRPDLLRVGLLSTVPAWTFPSLGKRLQRSWTALGQKPPSADQAVSQLGKRAHRRPPGKGTFPWRGTDSPRRAPLARERGPVESLRPTGAAGEDQDSPAWPSSCVCGRRYGGSRRVVPKSPHFRLEPWVSWINKGKPVSVRQAEDRTASPPNQASSFHAAPTPEAELAGAA